MKSSNSCLLGSSIICNIIWHLWFPTQTADHTTVKQSILSSMLKFTSPPISHVSQSLKRLINGLAGTRRSCFDPTVWELSLLKCSVISYGPNCFHLSQLWCTQCWLLQN